MGVARLKAKMGVEEYLYGEQVSRVKHEYVGGDVYARAAASAMHNIISSNLAILLRGHLKSSELRCIFP